MRITALFTALLAVLIASLSTVAAVDRGLAWGTDDRWGTNIAKGLIKWYWHWQDGPNTYFNGKLEFVPCFWGPSKTTQWNQRKAEMAKSLPKAILAFNEPDISSQSNMSPASAASLFKKEIWPYKAQGVRLGSPQIVWNLDWMASFLSECNKIGCSVDFIAIHWYGSWSDIEGFKKYVTNVRNRFSKPIWVTEYGVTSSSGGSQSQVKNFHMQATYWMHQQSWVERSSNFGSFAYNSPPDSYGSRLNALFNSDGSLRDMAYWYMYTVAPHRRSEGSNRSR